MEDDAARQIELFKAQLLGELETHKAGLLANQAVWNDGAARNLEAWKANQQSLHIMFEGIISFAGIAIRSVILVNGGAVIGILTFLGNLWNKDSPLAKATAQAIGPAISFFIAGVAFGLATAGLAYVAQVAFAEVARTTSADSSAYLWGNRLRWTAVSTAVFGLISFIAGAAMCMRAFLAPPLLG